MIANALMLRRV